MTRPPPSTEVAFANTPPAEPNTVEGIVCAFCAGAKGLTVKRCRFDQGSDGVAEQREHAFQPRMEEERLLVAHQEMVELHVHFRHINRQPEQAGRNFVDRNHGKSIRGRFAARLALRR